MKLKQIAFLAMVALALSGCGIQRQSIRDTRTIPNGSGVIMARIILNERNAPAYGPDIRLTAIKQSNLTVASLIVSLQSGENFSVMTLPAGKYSWRGIYLDNKNSEFRGLLPFEVQPGKVNYVGDLVISLDWNDPLHYGMRVASNQGAAEKYMKLVYPELTSRYPMVTSLTADRR